MSGNGLRCQQKGCKGTIQDGYCDVCGHARAKVAVAAAAGTSAVTSSTRTGPITTSSAITGTGSTPMSRGTKGSRRTHHSSSHTSRKMLGAGLITLPDLPSTEPEKAIMADAKVPEHKRFCPKCESALKREFGFCGKCGEKYSFIPSLNPGDMVAGQYEVKGALAFGGLGWIYLGFDKVLSRYVVLKGLLNVHDESSAATAVAERQFLAAVKHPNIVGIYNFVQHAAEGFIVMEYVGGKTLKQIRKDRGPLPVAEAIAYIHRILPAFAYLHEHGLVYCDFKPDNIMLEKDDVKLIDMGGVRRIDDEKGDIYGTVGYSAPEANQGPTAASDLFTIGRSLAVLLADISGFSKEHVYTLPSPQESPLFAEQESLYRFLLKSTAENPDDRFESADEMMEQLLGVLREVVSIQMNTPHPGNSPYFGGDILALEASENLSSIAPDWRHLPVPSMDPEDPGIRLVSNANMLHDASQRLAALFNAVHKVPKSREARLRLAGALIEADDSSEATKMMRELGGLNLPASDLSNRNIVAMKILQDLGEEDPWDWRVLWLTGRGKLMANETGEAQKQFDQVYFDLPGELAPKLALGLSAEMAGHSDVAIKMYDLVSRTDPGYVSACFGLARCLHAKGDRKGAVTALERVPPSSALYLRSRVEAARTLICHERHAPAKTDLARASELAQGLAIEGIERFRLNSQILDAALKLLCSHVLKPDDGVNILGQPLQESRLRMGLESALRSMARMVTGEEKIKLVDQANAARPQTLV